VDSVLAQTYSNIEIVVIVDGPDPATVDALRVLNEPRLRIVALTENVGGSEARNIGVRESKGDWIAFMDDDDEWLPAKTEKQLKVALATNESLVFVASQFIARGDKGDRVFPLYDMDPRTRFSDYLFCRTSILGGTGYVQTSTWFVSKLLANSVRFTKNLKRNQDVDWMLHAVEGEKAKFCLIMEPLAVYHSEHDSGRVSRHSDWRFHFEWAKANRRYFSGKAFGYFISTICAEDAVQQGESIKAFFEIVRSMIRERAFSVRCLMYLFYYLLVSDRVRKTLRMLIFNLRRIKIGELRSEKQL